MNELTIEQKKSLKIINEIVVEFELVVAVDENNIIIPKPPKP